MELNIMIEFKQFGIKLIQQLVTLPVEGDTIFFKHMCPPGRFVHDDPNAPWVFDPLMSDEDIEAIIWFPPEVVPLVKIDKPEDIDGKVWEPNLVWFDDKVERQWISKDKVLTHAEKISKARKQMAEIFDNLSLHYQSTLFPTRIAVEDALDRNRIDIAQYIISRQIVPPELLTTKQQILDLVSNL